MRKVVFSITSWRRPKRRWEGGPHGEDAPQVACSACALFSTHLGRGGLLPAVMLFQLSTSFLGSSWLDKELNSTKERSQPDSLFLFVGLGERIHLPCRRCWRWGFNPWVGKIPWRRKWQPTSVFLPEKSHGQRSLLGYSSKGWKELDRTERLGIQTQLNSKEFLPVILEVT